MPLAARPAMAPAKPGLVGAPTLKAKSRQASGPMESSGINVTQFRAFEPTSRVIQRDGGTARSSARTPVAKTTGEIAKAQPDNPKEAPGLAARNSAAVAATARDRVIANLRRKRTVSIA